MGGFGSGRPAMRPTVEGCRSLVLDVNVVTRPVMAALRRQGLREMPESGRVQVPPCRVTWSRRCERGPWAAVEIALSLGCRTGRAVLRYDVEHTCRPTGPQVQQVEMVATPCRFGGVRWWWLCPATGRRCAKLYLPNGGVRFLSRGRGAYPLAYASQGGGPLDRSHARLARIHHRLGQTYEYSDQPLPRRPKGMRRRTYERLRDEWDAALDQHEAVFLTAAARIVQRTRR